MGTAVAKTWPGSEAARHMMHLVDQMSHLDTVPGRSVAFTGLLVLRSLQWTQAWLHGVSQRARPAM
jgi:hypothetical protein